MICLSLLTIGELSKICDIPVKTLRYYDEIGLLKPDKISEESHYRFYLPEKILQIHTIKYYKKIGFKLTDIKNIQSRSNELDLSCYFTNLSSSLEKQIADLKKRHFAVTQWFDLINQWETLFNSSKNQIDIANIPVYKIFQQEFHSEHGKYRQCDHDMNEKNKFVKYCEEHEIFAYGPFLLNFENYRERMDNTFSKVKIASSIFENDAISNDLETIGGFTAITAIHKGNYDTIRDTYDYMDNWARERKINLFGAAFEICIIDSWSAIDSANYITKIILPFA